MGNDLLDGMLLLQIGCFLLLLAAWLVYGYAKLLGCKFLGKVDPCFKFEPSRWPQ